MARIRFTPRAVSPLGVPTAFALMAALASGCLSPGPPPVGRQMVKGRGAVTPLMFLPRPAGAVTGDPVRLLIWRLEADGQTIDLSIVETDLSAPADVPRERLLVERLSGISYAPCGALLCSQALDSHGRLVVAQNPPDASSLTTFDRDLLRVDPATGQQEDLGPVSYFTVSASGNRLVYVTPSPENEARVREPDDREIVLGPVTPFLVGDDVFFVASDGTLTRLAPSGARDAVATGVIVAYRAQDGSGNLMIVRAGDGSVPSSVVDTATSQETFLPSGVDAASRFLFSPSNRWILITPGRHQTAYTLIDRASGATSSLSFPANSGFVTWRAGHEEIWSASSGMFWITQTDGSITGHAGDLYPYYPRDFTTGLESFLSADGRYFFTTNTNGSSDNKFPVYVGLADDPDAKPVTINPMGSGTVLYWPLPDGRLVAQAFYLYYLRSNVIVVDPAAAASPRIIAEDGFIVGVGSRRVLALQHWATEGSGPGDLSLVDVDSGGTTWIAQSILSPVVVEDPAPGRDALAPGSHVAYVLVNRVASPYDGIWVAALP